MGIINQKKDNLVKLLNGLSLLDDQDQERIIRMVDTLDAVDMEVKGKIFSNALSLKLDLPSAYADDKK